MGTDAESEVEENAETESIADEADAESEAEENVETESIADEAEAESEAEENAETESIADEADAEAEEVASEAEEVDSEAEDDAESEAEIAIEVSKPVDNKPDAKTLEQRRRRDLEAGWVGIGSVKDYPLSPVAYNSVVRACSTGMRRRQRVAKKVTTIKRPTISTSPS